LTTGVTPAQFDNSGKLATTAFVKTAGLQFADYVGYAVSTTLPASICGKTVTVIGNGIVLTLPLLSSVPLGATVTIHPAGASGTIVQRQGSDNILGTAGYTSAFPLSGTDSITLIASTACWLPISGSSQAQFSSLFGASLQGNGYQKLPSGLIIQWGMNQGTTTSYQTYSFPIAFSNNVFSMVVTTNNVTTLYTGRVNVLSPSQFQIGNSNGQGSWAADFVSWIAIGR
jgi:hypothetical protein